MACGSTSVNVQKGVSILTKLGAAVDDGLTFIIRHCILFMIL